MIVYVHTCPNGKRYVGQTVRGSNKRWESGSGYKTQLFYRAILKYGWNNINHTVYEVNTKQEMDYLEKYLISYYNTTDPRYGYNITSGGEGVSGFKHSEESKKKMSVSHSGLEPWNKGLKTPEDVKKKLSKAKMGKHNTALQVAVVAVDSNGNELVFASVTDASKELHIIHQNISKCLKGTRKTAGGYSWRYA